MTITALANLKGGVGKTTVTNGLAHAAAANGRTCLVVDADMQGNSTTHLTGYTRQDPPEHTLADVLDRATGLPVREAIIPASTREAIHVLPSGFNDLQAVQDTLVGKTGGEMALSKALRQITDDYDHILIDCRPAIDLISRSALYAADNVIIVVQPEADAVNGLDSILSAIEDIAEYMDKVLPVAGIVVNKLDGRRKDHAETYAFLRDYAQRAELTLLCSPIPQLTDISKLTNVGMGMDQHPKPSAWSRNLHETFTEIITKASMR